MGSTQAAWHIGEVPPVRFDITPLDGMVDGDLVVRVTDGSPRARVNVTAEAEDADGRVWMSSAQFLSLIHI